MTDISQSSASPDAPECAAILGFAAASALVLLPIRSVFLRPLLFCIALHARFC